MAAEKIAITIDRVVLSRLDLLVRQKAFRNRSRAIQEAVEDKLKKLEKNRLAVECAKLDKKAEQRAAEEGMAGEKAEWPEY